MGPSGQKEVGEDSEDVRVEAHKGTLGQALVEGRGDVRGVGVFSGTQGWDARLL